LIIQQQELNPNLERVCKQCKKVFRRKAYIKNKAWEEKHKICSRECVGYAGNRGVHEHGRQYWFICCICDLHILGRKADLKQHKHEKHSH